MNCEGIDFCPEGIFGLVDKALDKVETSGGAVRKPKKLVPRAPRALPSFNINRRQMPKENENVEFENVVSVPDSLLREIAHNIDARTADLNKTLTHLLPLLLSYETSTNYTRAALKEGLNLEIDFDEGLAEAVRQIGYLNVLFHFIKKSKLPKSLKQHYMMHTATKLSEHTIQSLVDANKLQTKKKQLQELQAVVYSQKENKTRVHSKDDPKTSGPKMPGVSRRGRAR